MISAFALELLLSKILGAGGRKEDLEVKVFGGGHVLDGLCDIGALNVAFVRGFFAVESLVILSEDVGGDFARRLRYWPKSGRAQVLHMPITKAKKVIERESSAAAELAPRAGSVELF